MPLTPELAAVILGLVLKYGPGIALAIENALSKPDPTVKDIVDLFANVKPYEAYGIPDKVPTGPTIVEHTGTGANPTFATPPPAA